MATAAARRQSGAKVIPAAGPDAAGAPALPRALRAPSTSRRNVKTATASSTAPLRSASASGRFSSRGRGANSPSAPAGTSSGRKLRLRGKGIYRRDRSRGDQYVRIQVAVPKKLDPRSRELIEEFRKLNPERPDSVVES